MPSSTLRNKGTQSVRRGPAQARLRADPSGPALLDGRD
jgi:hypothetical protein